MYEVGSCGAKNQTVRTLHTIVVVHLLEICLFQAEMVRLATLPGASFCTPIRQT